MKTYEIITTFLNIPEEEYHAASQRGEFLSSHLLADFRRCPAYYQRKLAGKVEEKSRTAYTLGSAAHKLILEGNVAFDNTYLVAEGPVNPKTGAAYGRNTKAFTEWLEAQRKPVISPDEMAFLETLRSSVQLHEEAADLLSNGVAEAVVRANIEGIPCQIRMDWFNPELGIVDLKTTADMDWFESDMKRYGYIFQLAFYRAVLREATSVEAPVSVIAVEKEEPYRTGVWSIDPEVLDAAERINLAAIKRLARCHQIGDWPTGFEGIRYVTSL